MGLAKLPVQHDRGKSDLQRSDKVQRLSEHSYKGPMSGPNLILSFPDPCS